MKDAATILVDDDSPTNLELVSGVPELAAEGFWAVTADNRRDPHRVARIAPPDLILLDVRMPANPDSKPGST